MKNQYKKIIYFVYLLPVILMGYLLYQNTRPILNLEYDLNKKSSMIPELVPLARVDNVGIDSFGKYREILDEPVYLDVKVPRKYDNVKIEVKYSDLNVPIFELGVSRNQARTAYDFISLENNTLDNLDWDVVENNGLALYQREKKYQSVDGFLSHPSTFRDTLLYRAELMLQLAERYKNGISVIDFPIKNKAQIMVYHLGGELKVQLESNQNYVLKVFKDNNQLTNWTNLEKGVYKIELLGNSESIFKNIKINSPYIAIINGLQIGKLKYPIRLYAATSRLLFKADSGLGLQTIKIDNNYLEIAEVFKQYSKNFNNRWLKQIDIKNGNVELGGTLFFLHHWDLFYPVYEKFYPDVSLDGVNYILTNYKKKDEKGVIKKASVSFDIKNTPTPYGKLRFLLSLQGQSEEALVKIRGIKFKFSGEKIGIGDILQKIINKITKR